MKEVWLLVFFTVFQALPNWVLIPKIYLRQMVVFEFLANFCSLALLFINSSRAEDVNDELYS